jgi:peptide chain release factor 3
VVRRFEPVGGAQKVALLAAVGPLQFEVVQYRLQSEYNAESRVERMSWSIARWWRRPGEKPPVRGDDTDFPWPDAPDGARLAYDDRGRPIVLFTDEWGIRHFTSRNPGCELSATPFKAP